MTTVPISQQRLPHATVTTWWGHGGVGPLFLIFGDGKFDKKVIDRLNTKYVGEVFIMTSGKDTHFMDAGLTCDMWEQCLGPAVLQRREQLKMPRETHKGCFVFDAFTGNSS